MCVCVYVHSNIKVSITLGFMYINVFKVRGILKQLRLEIDTKFKTDVLSLAKKKKKKRKKVVHLLARSRFRRVR